jgi:hypothetical protein
MISLEVNRMKKWTIAFSLIMVLVFGLTSVGFAQSEELPTTPEDNPPAWQLRQVARRHLAWFRAFSQALADRLGLTLDELKTRVKNGETPFEIAQSQGMNAEDYQALLIEIREDLLNQAVANGKLTAEQADAIRQRWENAPALREVTQTLRAQARALLADRLGLSLDEINERISSGETLLEIAQAQGFSKAELRTMRDEIQHQVLGQAVADGTLTQVQAERIQECLEGRGGRWNPRGR